MSVNHFRPPASPYGRVRSAETSRLTMRCRLFAGIVEIQNDTLGRRAATRPQHAARQAGQRFNARTAALQTSGSAIFSFGRGHRRNLRRHLGLGADEADEILADAIIAWFTRHCRRDLALRTSSCACQRQSASNSSQQSERRYRAPQLNPASSCAKALDVGAGIERSAVIACRRARVCVCERKLCERGTNAFVAQIGGETIAERRLRLIDEAASC